MSFGGLEAGRRPLSRAAPKFGTKPGRLMCSYFTHFADTRPQEAAQRARQSATTRSASSRRFRATPRRRRRATATSSTWSIACGKGEAPRTSPRTQSCSVLRPHHPDAQEGGSRRFRRGDPIFQRWAEAARTSEGARMARFMAEVAPAFEGAHRALQPDRVRRLLSFTLLPGHQTCAGSAPFMRDTPWSAVCFRNRWPAL